jgi:hypothetical protein
MAQSNGAFSSCRPMGMWVARFALLWACLAPAVGEAAHVTLNEDGVLLIDGRKVLPIGFTGGPPPDGRTPEGKAAFTEIRDAGGMFFRTGQQGPTPWNDETTSHEQIMMDAAARYGLYCWPRLGMLSSLQEGERDKEARLRSVLERFRDHPGLLLWKNVDEPWWGKVPAEDMVRAYRIIKQVDPCHPVGLTQAPRGTVADLRPYAAAADILLLDIYPIGYPPGMHSLGPNKEISMVGEYTRFIRQVAAGKPIWMVLQIAWSGVVKPGKTLRFPTFAQERFMTYQALINGARGLVYFGGNLPASLSPGDARLGWNWTFWRRVLRPVLEEIGPKSPLAPALVAPESRLAVKVTGADDVEFCVREVDDDLYLLACKREGRTVQVQFTGLPPWTAEGEVLYESPRRVQTQASAFADWFAPFDVHVYRFRR